MKLTVVTNRLLCADDFLRRIERIAAAKPYSVVLREKDMSPDEYVQLALECKEICVKYGVTLTVNGFWREAAANGFDSIQLSAPVFFDRPELKDAFADVGVSVHSVDEAVRSARLGADRLIAGHIFPTDCKKGVPPRGTDFLASVCDAVDIPVFGIGGINTDNIDNVQRTAAAGVCIMSELMTCDDPHGTACRYIAALSCL